MTKLYEFDQKFRKKGYKLIAGFDEAGRGPLCGPVVAAGCILPEDFDNEIINDSKKLTDKKRRSVYELIKEKAIAYHISIISPQKIDEINILEASRLGMYEALESLEMQGYKPDVVLTDYMHLPTDIYQEDLVKGDGTSLAIAAASILAKVTRDDILIELDKKYPQYGLKNHKGYPTKAHLEALEKFGIIEGEYRLSYKPVQKVLNKIEK